MMEMTVDFLPSDRQLFGRAESLGDAFKQAARAAWPFHTAKNAEETWGLDPSTAENITKGHASPRALFKAARASGWALWMALGELIIGHSYAEFLESIVHEKQRAADRAAADKDHFLGLEARAAELVALCDRPRAASERFGDERPGPAADGSRDAEHHARLTPDDSRHRP